MIFQDECGIQSDITRIKGRIQDKNNKAQKLYGDKTGTKHSRTGLIAGYTLLPNQSHYQYIAPLIYQGNCATPTFNFWIIRLLLPSIKKLRKYYPNTNIHLVLDNVAYHKSELTQRILTQNNINLIFQPPYSPDLNPIEQSWTHTKNQIRSKSYTNLSFQEKLCQSLNLRTWCG